MTLTSGSFQKRALRATVILLFLLDPSWGFSRNLAKPPYTLGFGGGFTTATLFSRSVDQIFFPGVTVGGGYRQDEILIEFRGKFTFGEVDAYQVEVAGFRSLSPTFSRWFAGGGLGFGGMNQKELLIFEINGIPIPGVFYHNGKGLHAFMGGGVWLYQGDYFGLKADIDYYISLFNVNKIHTPTGLRFGVSVLLNAPE